MVWKTSLGLINYDSGPGDPGALCWVDAYEDRRRQPVLICSQLPHDPRAYVTEASRYIAARLLLERWPERAGQPDALIWFEYYSYIGREAFRSAFMRVRFESWAIERGSWGDHGARLGEIDVWETVRRADVRELVGREVGQFTPPLVV